MASEKECMCHASECVRLAGLTDDRTVRDQLLGLAQDWISAAQPERDRSDEPGQAFARSVGALTLAAPLCGV